jgi:hypothetical protein
MMNKSLLNKSLYEKIVERGLNKSINYDIDNSVNDHIKLYNGD